jgi:hypothetical protein
LPFNRREFLKYTGAGAAVLLFPPGCSSSSSFFADSERRGLGALADGILPPDDQPGGKALGAVAYIEGLLTAFDHPTPPIFLGGPYSGRQPFPNGDGSPSANLPTDGFQPIALDRVAERAWRLRLYGSSMVMGGGPNDALLGPVVGLRDQIKAGLADAQMLAGAPLDSISAARMAQVIHDLDSDFRDTLIGLVSQAAFGAPEYGGNPKGAGWQLTHFEGDIQPLGYTFFDVQAGVYRERADAPVSTASASPDPEPMDADTHAFIGSVITALGGTTFP